MCLLCLCGSKKIYTCNITKTIIMKRNLLFILLLIFGSQLSFSNTENNLAGETPVEVEAIPVNNFLNSLGINTSIAKRGESYLRTAECLNYLGIRWVRSGFENDLEIRHLKAVAAEADVKFSYGLGSGSTRIDKLIEGAKELAEADLLLALEGVNEPNNWGFEYQGEMGGGAYTWMPIAKLQRDMYAAVKSDPVLKDYPVFGLSNSGAQNDNVGLQYLTIPIGAGTLMPDGTKYADYANCHNYIVFPGSQGLTDNKTWISADPGPECWADGLYGNYGKTWSKKFNGYSVEELQTLPRVTTETGIQIGTEGTTTHRQGCFYLNLYLSQYKRGWDYTAIYILRDRSDETGNQAYGFYDKNYVKRKSADYLHNMTTVLKDEKTTFTPGKLAYAIPNQPNTVHDILFQKSDGTFMLVLWGENFVSQAKFVTINFDKEHSVINIFDPTEGETPINKFENKSSISLSVYDHPVILQFGEIQSNGIDNIIHKQKTDAFFSPGTDILNLFGTAEIKEIKLYSLTGNLIFAQENPSTEVVIPGLSSGVYLAQAKYNDGKTESIKIVKSEL